MFRTRKPSARLLGVFIFALTLLVVAQTAVLATTLSKKGGAVTQVKGVTADDGPSTGSIDWVAMPGMSTTVTVPGGQKALLIVTFSAWSQCSLTATVYCYVRVLADNIPVPPGETAFRSNSFGYGAQSMQWVAGPLSAGTHTIKIEWRVDEAYGYFAVFARTLTVLRSKV